MGKPTEEKRGESMNKIYILSFILSCTLGARITCLTQEDVWCYKSLVKVTADTCTSRLVCDREAVKLEETQQEYEHSKQEMSRTCQIFSFDENNL